LSVAIPGTLAWMSMLGSPPLPDPDEPSEPLPELLPTVTPTDGADDELEPSDPDEPSLLPPTVTPALTLGPLPLPT
jgi:hypothetical protein